MGHRILLVEDDTRLAELVAGFLRKHALEVEVAASLADARSAISAQPPQLILLDVVLPDGDGLEFCRELRPGFRGGILVLTARGEELDELLGFECGADDYMAKPVRPQVLLARVNALLRRLGEQDSDELVIGELRLDVGRRTASLAGSDLSLTDAELELLRVLMSSPGQAFTRDELFEKLRGIGYDGMDRSIDRRISTLRKKLGDDPRSPQHIRSVRGVGYMLMGSRR